MTKIDEGNLNSHVEGKHLKFSWSFQVLESHLDIFGHMNHANYLEMFEQARWEFITKRGYGLNKILQTQIGPTILDASIRYKRELRLREKIKIESICPEYKGKIGKVFQRMIKENGEEAATLEITVGLFDMRTRRLISATDEWLFALGAEAVV